MDHTPDVLPALAQDTASDLLARLDRAVPGRVDGFYVVGSACMGAFRAGRSDLDFVAILANELSRTELARLRAMHLGRWRRSLILDVALRWRWPLVCNGIYLQSDDLSRSPLDVTPLAGHVAGRFSAASREGFDVNPVTWHTLAHHGIAIRGPKPDRLRIHVDDAELRNWTLDNLNSYWRRWVERTRRGTPNVRALPRRAAVEGVLGAPRLHYTLATNAIATKEVAAQYALDVFEPRWHAVIEDALAWWRAIPAPQDYRRDPRRQRRDAANFVAAVIEAATA